MGIINWLQLTNCGQQRRGEGGRRGERRETSGDVTRNYAHGCTLGAFVARGLTTVVVRAVEEEGGGGGGGGGQTWGGECVGWCVVSVGNASCCLLLLSACVQHLTLNLIRNLWAASATTCDVLGIGIGIVVGIRKFPNSACAIGYRNGYRRRRRCRRDLATRTLHCIRCRVLGEMERREGTHTQQLKQIKDIRVYLICTSAADP